MAERKFWKMIPLYYIIEIANEVEEKNVIQCCVDFIMWKDSFQKQTVGMVLERNHHCERKRPGKNRANDYLTVTIGG